MADNAKQQPETEPVTEPKQKSFAGKVIDRLDLPGQIGYDRIARQLPFFFFLAGIAFVYIANSYYAQSSIRKINQIDKDLNELRWNYTASQSDLENSTLESQVEKQVAPMGLKNFSAPPKIIRDSTKHEH
jgi:hypothetical protein